MMEREPYCTVEYFDLNRWYRVYDHTGSLMVYTTSETVATEFLAMARRGISARLYRFLEYYHWRIPKRYLDRL